MQKVRETIEEASVHSFEKNDSTEPKSEEDCFQFNGQPEANISLFDLEENTLPSIPLCREEQAKKIEDFIVEGIKMGSSSQTLYIAGTPGIGKTLTVTSVIENLKQRPQYKKTFKSFYLNALNYTHPRKIYKAMLHKIFKVEKLSKSKQVIQLDYLFTTSENITRVIIIDELDYLVTKDESVLYNLFEWTQNPNSKLILITIANTFDLPESLHTRTCSRMGFKRIFFQGYSRDQIYQIVEDKLKNNKMFSKEALRYACTKIVNLSCDIRRALFLLKGSFKNFMEQASIKQSNGTQKVQIEHVQKAFNQNIRYKPQCTYIRTMSRTQKIVIIYLAICSQDRDPIASSSIQAVTNRIAILYPQLQFRSIYGAMIDLKEVSIVEFQKYAAKHIRTSILKLNVTSLDIKSSIIDEEFKALLEQINA